jgi:hypothetical protein
MHCYGNQTGDVFGILGRCDVRLLPLIHVVLSSSYSHGFYDPRILSGVLPLGV